MYNSLHQYACHESSVSPTTGYNGEEEKVISEVHKIWDDSTVAVFPTCMWLSNSNRRRFEHIPHRSSNTLNTGSI